MRNPTTSFSILLFALLAGCEIYQPSAAPQVDYYYLNPRKNITTVGRVAIIEFDNLTAHPELSQDFTEAVYQAVGKRNIFGLDVIYRRDFAYTSLQLDADGQYDLEQLTRLRNDLKVDAVLLGTVMQYESFPHMAVGLRVKLLDLRDGQLLWAVEQVWDSTDKAVEASIKEFFRDRMRSGYEPIQWELATVSPKTFRKFVAYQVARTLP